MRVATNEKIRARAQARKRSIRQRPLTIAEITELEPRIKILLDSARRDTRKNRDLAYSDYKFRLSRLVGWEADKEELSNSRTYKTTIIALCNALGY